MKKIERALLQYWGYKGFFPLQREAMGCVSGGVDSVVVLPTGGGKSLCFQGPAVTMEGLAVVVSPLISLMKDQVDSLKECGIAAERIDSSLSMSQQNDVFARINRKELKLLYLSPERLMSDNFLGILRKAELSFIAIDEAHCVSMWGHDFRPEYRQLGSLKDMFDGITIAAYTATATEHVRADIAQQLKLDNPQMIVGSFDRPNLLYKVEPRNNIVKQVCSVIERHKGESGIIYCIRRKDVDSMCGQLKSKGYKAAPYHAGMDADNRRENQDMFINEKVDIIVATVAFGMGIDKSNVRYVIHAGMPKSLEHYQQESGRGGRDGLEADCCLFYSGGDYGTWKSIMRDMPVEAYKIAMVKLNSMHNYCTGGVCRHKAILKYFGQDLDSDNCNACDVCLGELDYVDDALIIAQKILSCVARVEQRFGGGYVALVLVGSRDKRILENNHDRLSTYGLLEDHSNHNVRDWIEQLTGQDYIEKYGEYNVLRITEKGGDVLKGERTPRLLKPSVKKAKVSKVVADSWEGVDKELFETLRKIRSKIAGKKKIPAYIVFGDGALRDMARKRPASLSTFLNVKGVGEKKYQQYGETFITAIKDHCSEYSLDMDTDGY
ncbi:MAG TPA: DNA helicase RecQ [Phycisphaerales bacterium]|nr:DNA helicase RecQ [Phycisphaerales bacterium]